MIRKLFRGHGLIYQVRSTSRNVTCNPIQTMIGPSTPAPTAQPHVLPHCGQIHYAYHVLISEFPEGPTKQQTTQLSAGHREPFKSAWPQQKHRKTTGKSHVFVLLAGLPGGFDWPMSLRPHQFKVCFWSRARPCPDLRSGLHFISI